MLAGGSHSPEEHLLAGYSLAEPPSTIVQATVPGALGHHHCRPSRTPTAPSATIVVVQAGRRRDHPRPSTPPSSSAVFVHNLATCSTVAIVVSTLQCRLRVHALARLRPHLLFHSLQRSCWFPGTKRRGGSWWRRAALRVHHDGVIVNFGLPNYAASMVGVVLYPDSGTDGCQAFDHRLKSSDSSLPVILILDRARRYPPSIHFSRFSAAAALSLHGWLFLEFLVFHPLGFFFDRSLPEKVDEPRSAAPDEIHWVAEYHYAYLNLKKAPQLVELVDDRYEGANELSTRKGFTLIDEFPS
ncbi:hypothetical protein Taro_026872 [Colocasia esculenta]|uniref:Uncharacterized protein n=1 Tax=Colocasia esculenta TaxID=4460 RepID=A0A843VSL7_COLES|nr:hypothetical protein [Colocasia esculenta]